MNPNPFRTAIRAATPTALFLLAVLLIGCGGSNKFITPPASRSTMLILGTPSGAEYAELTKSYQPLSENERGAALIEKHGLIAVECNSFTAAELTKHATVKRALSSGISVVFLHMTEAHKKAVMLPAVGVSTQGTSPAVSVIQGKHSDHAHPGMIIESDIQIDAEPKSYAKGEIPTVSFPSASKVAAGRGSVHHSDPAAFVARIKEAASGALMSRLRDANDGLYNVPDGVNWYMVIVTTGDQNVTLPKLRYTQVPLFTPAWYVYVFDDLAVGGAQKAQKILIQGRCTARAKATPTSPSADDNNPYIGPPHIAYWLGSVVSAFIPFDANLSLVAASPASTQNVTTYTTSSSYSLGWTAGDSLPVASYSAGSSTSHDITKWNVYQFNRPIGGPHDAVYHTWAQNSPYNQLLPERGDDNVFSYWESATSYHLGDISEIANGNQELVAQNLAIFQVNNNADYVPLNPVIIGYLYEYNGKLKSPLIEYSQVFSPGVLNIYAHGTDTLSTIKTVQFIGLPNNQSDGRWNIPTGQQIQGMVEIAFTGTPPQRVTLFHSTDGAFSQGSGLRWTSGVDDPNGAQVTLSVTIDPNSGTMRVPLWAFGGGADPAQSSVWVTAFDPDSPAKTTQEISEKILLNRN